MYIHTEDNIVSVVLESDALWNYEMNIVIYSEAIVLPIIKALVHIKCVRRIVTKPTQWLPHCLGFDERTARQSLRVWNCRYATIDPLASPPPSHLSPRGSESPVRTHFSFFSPSIQITNICCSSAMYRAKVTRRQRLDQSSSIQYGFLSQQCRCRGH